LLKIRDDLLTTKLVIRNNLFLNSSCQKAAELSGVAGGHLRSTSYGAPAKLEKAAPWRSGGGILLPEPASLTNL
jgi:hypothetical protein